ncbi:hypothetical protein ACFLSQ_06155 [Bacteroidota bacterium]
MHQTVDFFLSYHPFEIISFNVGPGISFPNQENSEYELSCHIEIESGFNLWKIHLGPSIGYGFSEHDSHMSIGMQIGYGF